MEIFKLVGKIAIEDKQAKQSIRETTNEAESSESRIGGAFKKIGAAVAGGMAVEKVVEFGRTCVENAATVQAESAQFTAAFGKMKPEAEKMFDSISDKTGIMATRLKVEGTKAFSQFKGSGVEAGEALKMTSRFTNLAADAAAYYDMSLDEASERIRSFARGNMEAGDAIGLFSSDAQRNSMAVKMYGKEWKDLNEAQKQNLMLSTAEKIYKDSGAMGQAARESSNWATVTDNLKEAWKKFTSILGTPVMNALIPKIKGITNVIQKLGQDMQKSGKHGKSFTDNLVNGITTGIPKLTLGAQQIISKIGYSLASGFPKMVESGGKILDALGGGIKNAIPTIAHAGLNAVLNFSQSVMENMPTLIGKGMDFIKNLISGLMAALPSFIEKAPKIISNFANAFNHSVPVILEKGAAIIWEIIKGIGNALPQLVASIPDIFKAIFDVWTAFNWLNLGKNLMAGIKDGIAVFGEGVKGAFSNFGSGFKATITGIWNAIKTTTISLWNGIVTGVVNVFTTLGSNVKQIALGILNFFPNVWNNIKNTAITVWNGLKAGVVNIVNGLKGNVTGIVGNLKTIVINYFTMLKNIAVSIWNGMKASITSIINAAKGTVVGVVNSIKNTVVNIFNNLKTMASGIWNGIKLMMTNPIQGAKQILSSIINGIRGNFSAVFNGIRGVTSSVWNGIKNAISGPMNAAKDIVRGIINSIKGFFNFSIHWPHIPLPHFSISPAGWDVGDLVKGKIPHLGIEWYANGGIMEQPTLFGLNPASGNAMVGGEAGPEAIAPISKLQQYVSSAVQNENAQILDVLNRILMLLADYIPNMGNQQIVLDSGKLVGSIGGDMYEELKTIQRRLG